jgi:sortase A
VIRGAVRGLGELFITAGLVLLLFVSWQLWWTDVEANREQAAITDSLTEDWGDDEPPRRDDGTLPQDDGTIDPDPATVTPADYGLPPDLAQASGGEAFAILRIPSFGPDWQERPVLQGTGLDLLEDGVGHYEDTAMPGAVGNFAMAGHRVTYGRPFHQIAELQPGDPIVVETADSWYVYEVRASTIVTPDRVDVVAPVPEQPGVAPTERLMTLTACHPMYSARERYIVYAVMESWQPKSAGEPAALAAG